MSDELPLLQRRFEVGSALGQGCASVVRHVKRRDAPLGSAPLVVKTYRTEDPEMVAVAQREFQMLLLLRGHPNVLMGDEILEDQDRGRVHLVMRLAPGHTLSTIVARDGPLTEERARPILVGLLRALHWCHSHRVVHRDVKPENLCVDESSDASRPTGVVLCDFNIAARLGTDASQDFLAGGCTPTGTRAYLAPEMAEGTSSAGEMTDLWGAGLCLYLMLSGRLPGSVPNWHKVVTEMSGSEKLKLPSGISREAADLLQRLLSRKVETRALLVGALAHPWCQLDSAEIQRLVHPHFSFRPARRNFTASRAQQAAIDQQSVVSCSRTHPVSKRQRNPASSAGVRSQEPGSVNKGFQSCRSAMCAVDGATFGVSLMQPIDDWAKSCPPSLAV